RSDGPADRRGTRTAPSRHAHRLGAGPRGRRPPRRRVGARGGHRPDARRRRRGPGRAADPRGAPMRIEEGVELARFTTLGTGGPARAFARPESEAEVEELLRWAQERSLGVAVVGLGSNLLAADEGVDALVFKLGGELAAVETGEDMLRVGGGAA